MTAPTDGQNALEGMNFTQLTDTGGAPANPDPQARINFCTLNHCHPMRVTCSSYDGLRIISYGRWRTEDTPHRTK